MRKLININNIMYLYILILILGSVLPLNSESSSLNNDYTLRIRHDYWLHVLIYLPIPVLLGLYLKGRSEEQIQLQINKFRFWTLIALFSFIITALFELVQLWIPYRVFNINDLISNGVGAIIGLSVMMIFWKRLLTALAA